LRICFVSGFLRGRDNTCDGERGAVFSLYGLYLGCVFNKKRIRYFIKILKKELI